jgi:hypothetical protein
VDSSPAFWCPVRAATVRVVGAAASIIQEHDVVEPGGEALWDVRLQNTGSVVDQFTIEVLGEAADWAWVEPSTIELLPSAQDTVRVTFAPPRSPSVTAGPLVVGIRVVSREDPDGSVVEEGSLEVAPFSELHVELVPRTSKSAWRGKHEVAINNRGNVAATAELTAFDTDEQLKFDARPSSMAIDPGTVFYALLRVRPRKRVLYGEPKTLPFEATVQPADGDAAIAQGNLLQGPVIPKWAPRALAALAALAIAWLVLFRPTIESEARDSVSEPIAQHAERLDKLEAAVGPTVPGPDTPQTPAPDPPGPATPRPQEPRVDLGQPFDRRLQVISTNTKAAAYTVPQNRRLAITDVVLGNPQGDSGRVRVRRGGAVLLELGLQNFRDLDYHFVSPMLLGPGQKLIFDVNCAKAGVGSACRPSAYFIGTLRPL